MFCGSKEKKHVASAGRFTGKKTYFSNFQWIGGSVDQKTELGERKKTVTFFCVDPQRKPVTFVRGSTEKNLLLPDFQSVDPQKVKYKKLRFCRLTVPTPGMCAFQYSYSGNVYWSWFQSFNF